MQVGITMRQHILTCSWLLCAQGERLSLAVADDVRPASISPCGNYAVQILWEDGFNQVPHLSKAIHDGLLGLKTELEML